MFRRVASLTGLVSLAVLASLLSAGPAAAQNQGYSVWAHRYDGGGGGGRSSGGWRSRSYFVPQSSSSYYYTPAFTASAPITRSTSYYYVPAGTAPVNDRVTLNLSVPADAKIWVEGLPMGPGGGQRQFVSPPIQPGHDYTYDIQVSWKQDGREVSHKRHISVHAGDVINLTFPDR
jgi:uncharacterized protein (TIGR03000 family)